MSWRCYSTQYPCLTPSCHDSLCACPISVPAGAEHTGRLDSGIGATALPSSDTSRNGIVAAPMAFVIRKLHWCVLPGIEYIQTVCYEFIHTACYLIHGPVIYSCCHATDSADHHAGASASTFKISSELRLQLEIANPL